MTNPEPQKRFKLNAYTTEIGNEWMLTRSLYVRDLGF